MGRCYEFGVPVVDGCEHAMVVVAEGGACACSACGAHCLGKFAGCADIVAQPGYVPSTAPAGLVPSADRNLLPIPNRPASPPPTDLAPDTSTTDLEVSRALLVAVQSELDAVRAHLHALLDRPVGAGREEVLDAIERVRAELDARDAELRAAFDEVVAHYGRMADTIDELAARMAAVEHTPPRRLFRRE